MFKRIIFVAVVASSTAGTSLAYCHDDLELNGAAASSAIHSRLEVTRPTETLLIGPAGPIGAHYRHD